ANIWNASFSVPLREEADSSSEKLAQIPRGADVEQLGTDGDWIHVRFTDDGEALTGWVNTGYLSHA
ncbi:SH3 domain-containing protein, partial [Salmonella enterica]|uniref:SH3 domain-containing protein n=2 Tax=Bacteria TaxID=2 RepID=UPI003CE672FF